MPPSSGSDNRERGKPCATQDSKQNLAPYLCLRRDINNIIEYYELYNIHGILEPHIKSVKVPIPRCAGNCCSLFAP